MAIRKPNKAPKPKPKPPTKPPKKAKLPAAFLVKAPLALPPAP